MEQQQSVEVSQPERSAEEQQTVERAAPAQRPLAEHRPFVGGPFSLMRRFSEEMDRMFDDIFSELGSWRVPWSWQGLGAETSWPQVDVLHQDDKFVVKADVPGLGKDDLTVEVRDGELCISGERRSEAEEGKGGYYRTERSFGSFCRKVPLPEGAKVETAAATFDNGVLTVEMDAPQPFTGRRIEVKEAKPD